MVKAIRAGMFALVLMAGEATAQFCPGLPPWVFDDVPITHPFCTDITWMAQRGVTLGCALIDPNHRLYCPDANVDRGQMAAFMHRLGDAMFPLTCAPGQVMKWDGLEWDCANDNIGGSGGGGTVTSVAAGTGLQAIPNPITGAGAINLVPGYQLPQACAANQIPKWNGAAWTCAADVAGTGTVTSLSAGAGITLAPNPIVAAGTIAADTAYLQRRVSQSCIAGSSIRAIAADGSVTCETDDAGPANAFVQGGNAFGATAVLGTTDNQAFDVRVNGARVMRYEPNAISPNVIGGSPANGVTAGVRGATVAGGGVPVGDTDPVYTNEAPNQVTGNYGTVSGGYANRAFALSTVGGGSEHTTTFAWSTIGGGFRNAVNGNWGTVAGGNNNVASSNFATVGGGGSNTASGGVSTVSGGGENNASDSYSTVGGGWQNTAGGAVGTVGGGEQNNASGRGSTIGGGGFNIANGEDGTVAGGLDNSASGFRSSVGGGSSNTASGSRSAIAGGALNTASGGWSTVGGGSGNDATSAYSTVGGGQDNTSGGDGINTIGGGTGNAAGGSSTTIAGGAFNTTNSVGTAVGGGVGNVASGLYATVPGGRENEAPGDYSIAMGRRAKAFNGINIGHGTIVIADGNNFDFSIGTDNRFGVRATGGFYFVTAIDGVGAATAGVSLGSGDSSWNVISDRAAKANWRDVDGREVLAKLMEVPIGQWHYKAQDASIQHIGPAAQDFRRAFGLGRDDNTIATVDADGIALAAIQGLNAKLESAIADRDARLAVQGREIVMLNERVARAEVLQADVAALKAELAELRRERAAVAAR